MTEPINSAITFDDIGVDPYKDYDERKRELDPLNQTKGKQINAGVIQNTTSCVYDDEIKYIVGNPLITKRFSNINPPVDFNTKNTRLFHQSTLINDLSRTNIVDIALQRMQAAPNVSKEDKQKIITMLKTLASLAKLQENAYFETRRYNKG